MIRKLVLENFMAHAHTEIELGPGFTALTGPNNTGKSAVVEALRCLATNPVPKHFIRHGAKKARVEAHLEDGRIVAWVRSKTSAIYELYENQNSEPEPYAKIGKGNVPEDIAKLLRLNPVKLDTDKNPVDVHIGNQRDPIFLLRGTSSGARTAEFFASSTESAHLLAMQKKLMSRTREASREKTRVLAQIEDYDKALDQLAGLPDVALELEQTRELDKRIQSIDRELTRLDHFTRNSRQLDGFLIHARNRVDASSRTEAPPEMFKTSALDQRIQAMNTIKSQLEHTRTRLAVIAPLTSPPDLFSTIRLADQIRQLNTLKSNNKFNEVKLNFLSGLQETPMLSDLQPLTGLVTELRRTMALKDKADAVCQARSQAVEQCAEKLSSRVDELGSCPLCGSQMNPDYFISKGDK